VRCSHALHEVLPNKSTFLPYSSPTPSAVIYAFILLVVAVIACIFALRIAINATGAAVGGVELASIVASVLLALQIQVY
jgi:hypothetical protein